MDGERIGESGTYTKGNGEENSRRPFRCLVGLVARRGKEGSSRRKDSEESSGDGMQKLERKRKGRFDSVMKRQITSQYLYTQRTCNL